MTTRGRVSFLKRHGSWRQLPREQGQGQPWEAQGGTEVVLGRVSRWGWQPSKRLGDLCGVALGTRQADFASSLAQAHPPAGLASCLSGLTRPRGKGGPSRPLQKPVLTLGRAVRRAQYA